MLQKLNRNKIVTFIKWTWVIIVLIAAVFYVKENYSLTLQYLKQINPYYLALSFVIILISKVLMVDLVAQSFVEVGWAISARKIFSMISMTQLGKYIPGGIWQFVARFGAYKENRLSYKDMGIAFLFENIWMVTGAFCFGGIFLLLGQPDTLFQQASIIISHRLQLVLAILLLILWILGYLAVELFYARKNLADAARRTARLWIPQFVMWALLGFSFSLLAGIPNFQTFAYLVGGYVLSFLAGYVIIFAPGGIGIREIASAFLFAPLFSAGAIGVLVIVHRLLYTFAEFVQGFIGFLISRQTKDEKPVEISGGTDT